jgi:hypothetical protein
MIKECIKIIKIINFTMVIMWYTPTIATTIVKKLLNIIS